MKKTIIFTLISASIIAILSPVLNESIDRMSLTIQKKSLNTCMKEYAQVKRGNSVSSCINGLCTVDYISNIVFDKQIECLNLSDRYEGSIERYIRKYEKDYVPYGF